MNPINAGNLLFETITDEAFIFRTMLNLADDFYNKGTDKSALAKKLSNYGTFRIATVEREPAGFIGYYANDLESKIAFLSTIVISNRFHRRGIGTLLLRDCLSDCRKKGMTFCRLEVDNTNVSAIIFYKRFGFEKEKEASESSDYYICSL